MLSLTTPSSSIVSLWRAVLCCAAHITITPDSGHGGQTKDLDGDEADGFDEVIYPVDYNQAGHIVDDVSAHAV